MLYEPSDETLDLVARAAAFVEERLYPLEPEFLRRPFSELLPRLDELRSEVRAAGLWAPPHPAGCGGLGLALADFALVAETLGRSPLGHFVFGCQAPDAGNVELLHHHGSAEQKERWLEPLVTGKIRSCFAMTEVDVAGSNPLLLETRARSDGADFVLDGRKWYTTGAEGAAFAVVMAVTDPEAPPRERASMLVVPMDTPGLKVVRNLDVMGEAGEDFMSHAEIELRDCRVPATSLLGPEGRGFALAQERLGPGRIHHAMRWLGIGRRALDLMIARAREREIAPGRALAASEIVQVWIAESAAELAAARALTLATAARIDRLGFREVRREISMVKFVVSAAMLRTVDRALQAHGGLGMTDQTILAYFYRHERAARIYDGPDEVHKLALARRLLRARRSGGGGASG